MVAMTLPTLSVRLAATEAPACNKLYVTYDSVHQSIWDSVEMLRQAGWDTPDYLIAISGGGLIPARILRSALRKASCSGSCATIKVVGLELYDDGAHGFEHDTVQRTQWLELHRTPLLGKKILIVDEVDDSRKTLEFAVRELQADIQRQEEEAAANEGRAPPVTQLAVFVIHNKQRPKRGTLPDGLPHFVAQELKSNPWIVYPWDAEDINGHNMLSRRQETKAAASGC